MTRRIHNFGAGPAALPLPVLEEVRDELLDYRGSGMSILETSHRSARYSEVHEGAIALVRELLGGAALSDGYEVLLMGGGARTQFGLVPWNLMAPDGAADYLVTGHWAEMAAAEGAKRGRARVAWSSASTGHDRVPAPEELAPGRIDPPLGAGAAYVHYTSNNTIYGTQYGTVPDGGEAPLVCDMSSDVLSGPLDLARFGLIYAGAQKNLGPAGVTVVIVRRDLLERSPAELPDTLSYARMAAKRSLLNTPPVFAIYVLERVLRQLRDRGGLEAAAERNREKAALLYRAIDGSGGFYRGHARPESRSLMNVTFRLPSPELEERLLAEAAAAGLGGLEGHRSVGGVRASLYNAVELDSVRALVGFLEDFARRAG